MHIKEIIIHGFKSYANRTKLNGFSKFFNAITGLNGSGKSNILDAICFVLGIKSLNQVRAKSKTQLIYKEGQTAVQSASVTIIFDNSNESESPKGYEDVDPIIVGRKVTMKGTNKYILNGKNQTMKKIQDFFSSAKLNVNNSHFLIMQGHITKVVNMKPKELMNLLQEAAGTGFYESKIKKCLEDIKKKERKVSEYTRMIQSEIQPMIEERKKEKKKFESFKNDKIRLKRLNDRIVGHKKKQLFNNLVELKNMIEKKKNEIKEINEEIIGNEEKIKEMKENLKVLDSTKNLSKEVKEKFNKEQTEFESKRREYDNLEKKVKRMEEKIREKRNEHNEIKIEEVNETKVTELKNNLEQLESAYVKIEEKVLGRKKGNALANEEKFDETTQLLKNEEHAAKIEGLIESLKIRINSGEEDLEKYEKIVRESSDKNEIMTLGEEKEKIEKSVKNLESEIQKRENNNNIHPKEEIREIERKSKQIKEKMAKIKKNVWHFIPYLENKEGRFPRLGNVITLNDKKYGLAIETLLGRSIFAFLTETDSQGQELINRNSGRNGERIEVIPLNKIACPRLKKQGRVAEAKKKYGAVCAIDCVSFDKKYERAVKFFLGTCFIAENMDNAEKVKNLLKTKTCSLCGSVYESGTVTGGYMKNTYRHRLLTIREASRLIEEEKTQNEKRRKIEKDLIELRELKNKYSIKKEKLKNVIYKIENNTVKRAEKKVNKLNRYLNKLREDLEQRKESLKSTKERISRIKLISTSIESLDKKELDKKLKELKKQIETETRIYKAEKKMIDNLKYENENNEKDKKKIMAEINKIESMLEPKKMEMEKSKKEFEDLKIKFSKKTDYYRDKIDEIKKSEDEYNSLYLEIGKVKDLNSELNKNGMKIKESREKDKKKMDKNKKTLGKLKKKYPDIEEILLEEEEFKTLENDYLVLKDKVSNMDKSVNKNVEQNLEELEREYENLKEKREKQKDDKKNIEKVIEDLDEKKEEKNLEAFKKVNQNFGEIFQDLLKGYSCKLVPIEENLKNGFRIKVKMANVWKNSLTELSGGQRSLLALSLILSLCLYNPAPMYILDEIDAALDPTHTKNIGSMLKKHFKGSQFIVVSLKEGMFKNADVVFQTKFANGCSNVKRKQMKKKKKNRKT